MKSIEIDEELYQFIASKTEFIGESASSILRRLLAFGDEDSSSEELVVNTELTIDDAVNEPNDSVVNHSLSENVNEKFSESVIIAEKDVSVFDFINKEELATQRGAVGRFLLILAALYRVHSEKFNSVCDIRGRDRLYFALSEEELAESGSSTKPRQIPDSPFWVITNSNTTRKKMMLTEVAISLGYSASETEQIRDLL